VGRLRNCLSFLRHKAKMEAGNCYSQFKLCESLAGQRKRVRVKAIDKVVVGAGASLGPCARHPGPVTAQ